MKHLPGLGNFVHDIEATVGNASGTLGELRLTLSLPGGNLLLEGLDDNSATTIGRAFRHWLSADGDNDQDSRIVCRQGKGFRESSEIDWKHFMGVEYFEDELLFSGFGWLARVPRNSPKAVELWISPQINGRNLEDLWENVLRAVTACRLAEEEAVLIHACAVVLKGRAVVIPGISGAGKSTLAGMFRAAGRTVLSDDCVAVFPDERGGYLVRGLPFGGNCRPRPSPMPAYAPVAVFLPQKSSFDRVEMISPGRAAAALICCAPFVNGDPYLADRLSETVGKILTPLANGRLFFSLSGRCVPMLDELPD